MIAVVRKLHSLEVLGDDLELVLHHPVHDAVDGVGVRVLAAEVCRVPQRLHAARRRERRRVRRHRVHAAVQKEVVQILQVHKEKALVSDSHWVCATIRSPLTGLTDNFFKRTGTRLCLLTNNYSYTLVAVTTV